MRLASAALVLLVSIVTSHVTAAQEENEAYDLTDKNQFSFFFRDKWETMFNTPQPVANPAKAAIVSVLASPLYYQPCYAVERKEANQYYEERLYGMQRALTKATVTSSKVSPMASDNNDSSAILEMEFVQEVTYVSYTTKFHTIQMTMKARKEEVDKPFRVYSITDHCG